MKRLAVAVVLFAGCHHPHDIEARYALQGGEAGAVDVILNQASSALTVAIDDHVVVDRKYSRRAHIEGVPAGEVHVRVATGGSCEQGRVDDRTLQVEPGQTVTIALPGPEISNGCAIFAGLNQVALSVELVSLAVLAVVASPINIHVAKK